MLTDDDVYLFNEGSQFRLWEKLGARVVEGGTWFGVWAPNAETVAVIGDFNDWDPQANPLQPRATSGIWEGLVPGVGKGTLYKFHIVARGSGWQADKTDPMGVFFEVAPKTAAIVWDLEYDWNDGDWMHNRRDCNSGSAPWSIYELHIGSWMRDELAGNNSLSYRDLALRLGDYCEEMGFTHVELLPITEHPFFGSWGYQATGFFAPTSRYGTPQDFMYLVDDLHRRGIGVILDWVPSHFPTDEYALGYFDGTHLYEHADPRRGFHPDWNSYIFNYGRHEVRSFLISSALFWLERYHIDGIRVDAVASMLYLDYSRKAGEWIPNDYGGRENLEAIDFLRRFNKEVYGAFPDVQTIAEESTAWPLVSRPTYVGGLGFGMKWDMGWMHDTLQYMSREPVHRKWHQNELTFRGVYAFSENYVLPLSHDEVVHGKGSLLGKMPGDEWQKFANLRLLFAYMYATPGKKLIFMGDEFGQGREWNHDSQIDWYLLQYPSHKGLQRFVTDLNHVLSGQAALHEWDFDPKGWEWIDANDSLGSSLSFMRTAPNGEIVVCVFNFTPVARPDYRLGVPRPGFWQELLNSDAADYGGSGWGNLGGTEAREEPGHGRPWSLTIGLPPLGAVFFKSAATE
ncbi:MAG: 1,4-alpha-glucan branching protein GlgB [Chloroflexota bacterium]